MVSPCNIFIPESNIKEIQPRYYEETSNNIPFVQAEEHSDSPKTPSTSTMPQTKSETKAPVESISELRAENALKLKEWKKNLDQERAEAVRSRQQLEERVKKLEEEDTRQTERMDDVEEKIAKLERGS